MRRSGGERRAASGGGGGARQGGSGLQGDRLTPALQSAPAGRAPRAAGARACSALSTGRLPGRSWLACAQAAVLLLGASRRPRRGARAFEQTRCRGPELVLRAFQSYKAIAGHPALRSAARQAELTHACRPAVAARAGGGRRATMLGAAGCLARRLDAQTGGTSSLG